MSVEANSTDPDQTTLFGQKAFKIFQQKAKVDDV